MSDPLVSSLEIAPAVRRQAPPHAKAARASAGRRRRENILIMTATILPQAGVPNLMRSDPAQRRADYERALGFYVGLLGSGIDHIVFAENSSSDLESLRAVAAASPHAGRVSFLSCYALDYPPNYDRGYGELLLLDRVMEELSREPAAADALFWKVTGRYMVRNIIDIIDRAPADTELFLHCRNRPKKLVDMYFMGWTARGYETYLRGKCDAVATSDHHVRSGIHPEELFRSALTPDIRAASGIGARSAICLRMRPTPELQGVRAGDNKEYSVHNRWKYWVRKLAADLFPFVWI